MGVFYPPFRIGGGGTSISKDETIIKITTLFELINNSGVLLGDTINFETGSVFESGSIESFTTTSA